MFDGQKAYHGTSIRFLVENYSYFVDWSLIFTGKIPMFDD